MTTPQRTSSSLILANRRAAQDAASELLIAAFEHELVVTSPTADGKFLYRLTADGTGTYTALTADEARLAFALAGCRRPLLRVHLLNPPAALVLSPAEQADEGPVATHMLEATPEGGTVRLSAALIDLQPVYEIRAIRPDHDALVRSPTVVRGPRLYERKKITDSVLADMGTAKKAAGALLTAAHQLRLFASVSPTGAALLVRRTEACTYVLLTEDEVKLTSALRRRTKPLLSVRPLSPPINLGDHGTGTHRIETTDFGDTLRDKPVSIYLPSVSRLREITPNAEALVG